MSNKKIVVASVPFTDTTAPMMAPALLKAVLVSAGVDCVGIDLNGIIYRKICNQLDYDQYLKFFYHETLESGFEHKIKRLFDTMTDEILQHNPDMVCLSLLHYQCQVAAKWLSFCLKRRNDKIKIVIGGAGAFGSGLITNEQQYTSRLKEQQLIDHYISGDGDIALVELVKGNLAYPGIDTLIWKPLDDLNAIAYPDYDDYDFNMYESPFIGILGSRGCVRQCTFCDIHEYWEKFKWRTGDNIFEEMLSQNKKYGARHFKFQDSLINGNVREYNRLIFLLAKHNREHPDNTLHWASYFILRPATQMNEEHWQLTAASGAVRLNIGIESFVEKNRYHIKKKFSNADIDYGLAMAQKYNIGLTLLMLVGYVTETEQDHLETLQWLRDHVQYRTHPIKVITIGGTLAILPGTWLGKNQTALGVTWKEGMISMSNGNNHLWEIKSTCNDYETRIRRQNEILAVGQELGFNMNYSVIDPQKELENVIKERMNSDQETQLT